MHELEQEVASAARFIIDALDSVTPYYWEMPSNFMVPSVSFPTPEIETAGDSLDTYEMAFTWHVKLFHKTDGEAQNLAQTALVAIKNARNCLPLYNEDGSARRADLYRRPTAFVCKVFVRNLPKHLRRRNGWR